MAYPITRQFGPNAKGSELTFADMDNNLLYLDSKVTGSSNYIPMYSGSTYLTSSVMYQLGGNVGIGTLAPSEKISVIGNIDIPANTGKIGFFVGDAFTAYGSSSAHYGMSYIGQDSTVILSGYASLRMFTTGTERLSILGNGNVGIGTTTPNSKLNVNGNTIITGSLNVLGTTALTGNLTVSGSTTMTGSLRITGSVTSSNGMLVSNGGISVVGQSTFDGGINLFESSLNLNGEGSNININDGELTVTGSIKITGSLNIRGPITISSTDVITGSVFVSGSIGYFGVGSTVTQTGTRASNVTINNLCGTILMVSAAGSATANSFVVTNNKISIADTVILSIRAAGVTNLYDMFVTDVQNGSFRIVFRTTGGTAIDTPYINFTIFKGATS
jgi:hypothetical protein